MRVFSIPGRRSTTQYFEFFCAGLDAAGVQVIDKRDRDARRLRFDILHLHFPYHYVIETDTLRALIWFGVFFAAFCSMKLLRKKIVYTVHDVTPFHPRREWLLWPFMHMLHRATDGYVFLSPSSQAAFHVRFPGHDHKPFILLGHGAFPVARPDPQARRERRAALLGEGDALMVGFLGFRRPRKGLDTVTMLPERLPSGRAVRLLVAGGVQPSFAAEADAILARVPPGMLVLENRALSDAELNVMIQSVDIVLLPYTISWNSGMAMLVLSNRARLLGADMPVFADLAAVPGAPWAYTFPRTQEGLVAALERVARDEPDAADQARLEDFLETNSFARGGVRLRGFYEKLVQGSALEPQASSPIH